MLSFRNGRRLLFGLAFVLVLGRTVLLVVQGRLSVLDLPQVLGTASALLLLGVLAAWGGLRPPAAAAPVPSGQAEPVRAPVRPGPPTSRFGAAPPGEQFATAAPPSGPASAPAPAPAFAAAPGSFSAHAAPSLTGSRPAPRELTPLRSTTVASLASEHTEPEPAPAQPVAQDGERRWGSPAAPGSATQVLPQRGRGRRRPVPVQPRPAAVQKPAVTEPVVTESPAEPVAEPVVAPLPPEAVGAPQPLAVDVPAPRSAPAKVDLTPRPGDPTVGAALLGPARAKLHELEPPLVRSWLTLLEAGQRGEPTPVLKAGQLAVLAAGLEDAAVRRRLLRAVADPLVDAVGLVTKDLPLEGLDCASAPVGRIAAARELLLLVARTTTGTPAQGAAVRAVTWLDRPAQG